MTDSARQATRIERDSMGEMEVPADALYGASTQRAVLNFPISGERFPRGFIRALALIKLAAAETNAELGLVEPDVASAIAAAAGEIADGALRRAVPDRRLPDRLGHVDQHQHERGGRAPRRGPAGRRAQGPPERCRQPLPELERRDPHRAPAGGRRGDRGDCSCPPSSGCTPRSWPRSRSSGPSSRPAARTSRTRRRSGLARNSAAMPARSRSRSGGPGPRRPSCSRCRWAARRSGPGSTPTRSSRSGPVPACRA